MTQVLNITHGYNVISDTTKEGPLGDRLVRTLELVKPRGQKIYLAVIRLTLGGDYVSHAVIG